MAEQGVLVGDVTADRAIVWSRADRRARMWVSWRTEQDDAMVDVRGPMVTAQTDMTGQLELQDLPADTRIVYTVRFEDPHNGKLGDPVTGSFRTAPAVDRDITFLWSGELGGGGWGIDRSHGGYRIYQQMLRRDPDFLIYSGNRVFADQPLPRTRQLADGTTWSNLVTPARAKLATTLEDFRGCFRYNHRDEWFRRFHARVPLIAQWSEHEVVKDWHPEGWVYGPHRAMRDMSQLALRARQALAEYTPMRATPLDWARIYRHIPYGPLLDIFVLDTRSYRGFNGQNNETTRHPSASWLGRRQLEWLTRSLVRSTAVWKVVACPEPLSVIMQAGEGKRRTFDGLANGSGPPRGREQELAHLLFVLKNQGVDNVVWLTSGVGYSAVHHYHPARADHDEFAPFWEFVAGPLHGEARPARPLDSTFGARAAWTAGAQADEPPQVPSGLHQMFGEVRIAGSTQALTVRHLDVAGEVLHTEVMLPRHQGA